MDTDQLIKLWGYNKLKAYYSNPHISQFYPHFDRDVNVDDVYVSFYFDEGYACCGGSDPNCYCSFAQSPRAEININANGYGTTINYCGED